jgi:hypothetical protein
MKGIIVNVLANTEFDNCSMGYPLPPKGYTLTGEGVAQVFEPSDQYPEAVLVKRTLFGGKVYYHAEPKDLNAAKKWCMASGRFLYSSDSRFGEACGSRPIALHDRVEN